MMFDFSKSAGSLQVTSIKATFTNLSTNIYTDFLFQAAVPKFLQLHLDPTSSTSLPANANGSITQTMRVTNSQHGKVVYFGLRLFQLQRYFNMFIWIY
ncbi:AP-1 complex subunit gamma-1-like [Beta vulgaris subsp. vulgaris]|uniref:AP-1 complex subunit gamma-1-like n=1 Tax=Beta vulgaris subsp. vulgaris TaxID=3555 RepID=UPI0025496D0E|nr:AP-1 complex subunit gamma-1-like [Beta vulgaris subsp. vulgaris]